ncbi:phosphoribosyl 1,2-cyclic phosphate phosphodiesterase [Algoriphagus alkaliphilus]|uniref:Phosphoribosyl 1,2-cyclic phosphate phosphodiesterase n=1 Tax=Algoriphagus alkaliphilus TaxID=279824 RepID=A0A1G5X8G8_9BACT|nr:MBL fold metallo-hydrolase [Algoriphagus alkaliphilus]MBA4299643.1 MBL fold metallo-hydrolase [Cyclobacterium sp.]SDA66057.1 phosphoribosyl 1,2-cyclic phosphate phosphodiesterase [Algoriphagus alkaliphilus]
MKVTFLGTGTSQGVPVIGCDCQVCKSLDFRNKRFRTSIHLEANGVSVVVDTGPDFRMQMLRAGVKRLDAVIYTHEHKDHTAGLDDIRPFNFSQKMDIPIFGQKQVLDQIRREFSYIFSDKKYPGVPQVQAIEITENPFRVDGLPVIPIPVLHYKLPVLGFRFGDFSYITDANFIPDESLKLLEGTEILVLNALQKESHISHFTLDEAVHMARKIGAKQTYFTHIAHRLGLHEQVDRELPAGIALAYDGLELTLE